jgi:hypothetical protein
VQCLVNDELDVALSRRDRPPGPVARRRRRGPQGLRAAGGARRERVPGLCPIRCTPLPAPRVGRLCVRAVTSAASWCRRARAPLK